MKNHIYYWKVNWIIYITYITIQRSIESFISLGSFISHHYHIISLVIALYDILGFVDLLNI
jgi:hypothetical protein